MASQGDHPGDHPHMIDEEAICVVSEHGDWQVTAAFRNGTPDSLLAVDVGNEEEFRSVPDHMRSACWPVSRPCVTVQASSLALLRDPHNVRCLAHWLLRAAEALEAMP